MKKNLKDMTSEIVKLYEEKNSIRAIAKIVDGSISGVKRILNKENVAMRNKCASLNLCPDALNKQEYDLLLGSILGDGGLTVPKTNGESQFYVGHGLMQKEYIEHKHDVLKRWVGCRLYPLVHNNKNGKQYTTLNFLTRKNAKFTELRKLFYNNDRKKIIPAQYLEDNLVAESLAYWYMDDGTNIRNKGCQICSESFTEEDNQKLAEIVNKKFNLKFYLIRIRSKEYRLSLYKKDKTDFFEIIRKHTLPLFTYKLESSETTRHTSIQNEEDIVRSAMKVAEVQPASRIHIESEVSK